MTGWRLIYHEPKNAAEQHDEYRIRLLVACHHKREREDCDAYPEAYGVFSDTPEIVFSHEQHGGCGDESHDGGAQSAEHILHHL